jgi:hypothetical protein
MFLELKDGDTPSFELAKNIPGGRCIISPHDLNNPKIKVMADERPYFDAALAAKNRMFFEPAEGKQPSIFTKARAGAIRLPLAGGRYGGQILKLRYFVNGLLPLEHTWLAKGSNLERIKAKDYRGEVPRHALEQRCFHEAVLLPTSQEKDQEKLEKEILRKMGDHQVGVMPVWLSNPEVLLLQKKTENGKMITRADSEKLDGYEVTSRLIVTSTEGVMDVDPDRIFPRIRVRREDIPEECRMKHQEWFSGFLGIGGKAE